MRPLQTIALDLEGTLISNVVSQFPRPGLYGFLEVARRSCSRLLVFTAVRQPLFREVAATLVAEGAAPLWFADLECWTLAGEFKDLSLIPGVEVKHAVLIDDLEAYVHPAQRDRWIRIRQFDPLDENDLELARVGELLRSWR